MGDTLSFVPLPKNTAKDAVLVEQKSGTTTDVNITNESIDVTLDSVSIGVTTEATLTDKKILIFLKELLTQQKLTNLYLSQIVGEEFTDREVDR